jgi:hypothetical protein
VMICVWIGVNSSSAAKQMFSNFCILFSVCRSVLTVSVTVVHILYDSQTSEAALSYLRIGASSSLALLVFLPMVWADMFQLKLHILSVSPFL